MNCSSCGSENPEGNTECANCKAPLVDRLPDDSPRRRWGALFPAIPDHMRPSYNRPLLLKVVPYVALLWGGAVILVLLLALTDGCTFSIESRFSIEEKIVSGKEFLAQVGIPLSLLALGSFAVAYTVLRELPWSRHLLIACL